MADKYYRFSVAIPPDEEEVIGWIQKYMEGGGSRSNLVLEALRARMSQKTEGDKLDEILALLKGGVILDVQQTEVKPTKAVVPPHILKNILMDLDD